MGAFGNLIEAVRMGVERRVGTSSDDRLLLRASGVSTYSGP
ncbi:hypothetical protein QA600_09365 [Natronococcus sp. A-GB1]|nr:hypothetical protein [Natronococcus sp. A-GB1]MDG5759548.1 hypothetical protein [Natronococcus sp. A-GB1]